MSGGNNSTQQLQQLRMRIRSPVHRHQARRDVVANVQLAYSVLDEDVCIIVSSSS